LGGRNRVIGPSGRFLADFMEFSATNPQLKFHKYCICGYFRVNLGTFFFKMRFSPKIVLKTLKKVFQSFFRSWRWLLFNFESFLINWNFDFWKNFPSKIVEIILKWLALIKFLPLPSESVFWTNNPEKTYFVDIFLP
jgi:hypothetical protein